jgi:demethylmenaquinone methyltransferase/2-methoxy-6-polyprenyl-1,4-benzoquinol methylase
MSLTTEISTPEGKRRYVRSLFARIADRYDFITVALSYGQDARWKKRLVDLALAGGGGRALDLATGTGDIAFALVARGARAVGLDLTERMVELARRKVPRGDVNPSFMVGDMAALPFPDASFDLVTTGYGLRNVPDLPVAVDEICRVLKPSGRVVSLDFNRPANVIVRETYLRYLAVVGGALGWLLHSDPDTYRYIPASIRNYPGAEPLVALMAARGFVDVTYVPVLGGLMAIHHGRKGCHRRYDELVG